MVVIEKIMTLDGGSLGSGIDEERSKVRETIRTTELMVHRYFERKWQGLLYCSGHICAKNTQKI